MNFVFLSVLFFILHESSKKDGNSNYRVLIKDMYILHLLERSYWQIRLKYFQPENRLARLPWIVHRTATCHRRFSTKYKYFDITWFIIATFYGSSKSLTNDGLKGGSSFREITSCQLMCLKKLWFIICSASSGPDPNRCDTCLCNQCAEHVIRFLNTYTVLPRRTIPLITSVSSLSRLVLGTAGGTAFLAKFSQWFFSCRLPWTVAVNKKTYVHTGSYYPIRCWYISINLSLYVIRVPFQ